MSRPVPLSHWGRMSRPRSRDRTLWVSAPTEMMSTPVSATSRMRANVIPPLASTSARPAIWATAEAKLGGGEVVEQDGVGACGQDCFDLLRAIHFHLHMRGVGKTGAHGPQSLR